MFKKAGILTEKNSLSNFTQLQIKFGTLGQARSYLVSLLLFVIYYMLKNESKLCKIQKCKVKFGSVH